MFKYLPVKPHIQTMIYRTDKDIFNVACSSQDLLRSSMFQDLYSVGMTFHMCFFVQPVV